MIAVQSRLTTVIPYKFRPEDNWRFKISFVDELGAVFNMDNSDLSLSVYSERISRNLGNTISDGTNDMEKILCQRRILNLSEPDESGIYLLDQDTQTFRISYGQKRGQAFIIGKYFATLYQITPDGDENGLVSFDISVTNEIEDTGNGAINIDRFVLPIQKVNNAPIQVTIKI